MIKPEDIGIRSVNYKTLDNGACGVEVEWSTPEIFPNIRVGLYSLPYQNYKEYCEMDSLWNWCKEVVYLNEFNLKSDYGMVINDPATKVYLFHGTNAKMLDDFLVRGTFFTTDLTIAMKYGKTIYAFELKKARAREVEDAYKAYATKVKEAELKNKKLYDEYLKLRNKFVSDYGSYHMSYTESGTTETTFADLINEIFGLGTF